MGKYRAVDLIPFYPIFASGDDSALNRLSPHRNNPDRMERIYFDCLVIYNIAVEAALIIPIVAAAYRF